MTSKTVYGAFVGNMLYTSDENFVLRIINTNVLPIYGWFTIEKNGDKWRLWRFVSATACNVYNREVE